MEYLARTLIAPIIDGRISSLEVKATAENQWVNSLQRELKGTVFEAGCSNWYLNTHGRNSASWPGYASSFWRETRKSQSGVFKKTPGSVFWIFNAFTRYVRTTSKWTIAAVVLSLAAVMSSSGGIQSKYLPGILQGTINKA